MPVKGDIYYQVEKEYDDFGMACFEKYYDAEGSLMASKNGSVSLRRVYAAKNIVDEIYYYGFSDEPILINSGYASLKRERDDRNNVIRESYFGLSGEPIEIGSGYAYVTREWTEKNLQINELRFTLAGQPCPGVCRIEYIYDENGKRTETHYYTADGTETDNKGKPLETTTPEPAATPEPTAAPEESATL